jgi:ATP-dependent Clp protease protease subunit
MDNIVWVTHFDQESTQIFYDKFSKLENDPIIQVIPVFINSYGGEVHSLIAMRDIIKSSTKPVATVGLGMAMSCGAALLAAGTKGYRFAGINSQIMIHEVSASTQGKTSDMQNDVSNIHRLNQLFMSFLSADSKLKGSMIKKQLKSLDNGDWHLTAEDAKKLGLVDHVGVPRFLQNVRTIISTNPVQE